MKRRLGKQIISLVLVFCTLLSLLPVSALAAQAETTETESGVPFHDVAQDAWYYDSVMYAYVNGLVNGTGDTTFDPQGGMTRGMFVTVLGRMAGVNTENYLGQSVYSDVAADKYYAPYVAWASKHGITTGTGDGIFSPESLINRQQLATFFVRYCEAFDVEYGEDTVTTQPADIDEVADWAKDAVLTLWSKGILNGDGTNFNPTDEATRAEAVTLSTRMDAAVETWYSEPGVESDRVRIDPTTGEPVESESSETSTTPVSPVIPSWPSGGSTTTYYTVTFHMNGETESKAFVRGTLLSTMPVGVSPEGKVFLGWYKDEECTQAITASDVLTSNIHLYAKYTESMDLEEVATPNFVSALDQESSFVITVLSKTRAVITATDFKFTDLTASELTDGDDSNGETKLDTTKFGAGQIAAVGGFEPGHTYQVELLNDNLIFDDSHAAFVDLKATDRYDVNEIRYFNFTIAQAGTLNLDLDDDIQYISIDNDVSGGYLSKADADKLLEYAGLYQVTTDASGAATYTASNGSGTFTYTKDNTIQVGDIVAVYTGTKPTDRNTEKTTAEQDQTNNGEVAYVKITAIEGNTYTYVSAEAEEVLFMPDILPVSTQTTASARMVLDGDTTSYNLTVYQEDMQFSSSEYAEMGLNEQTTVDVGDFIAIYNGALGEGATSAGYGRITAIVEGVDDNETVDLTDDKPYYYLTYVMVREDEVYAAMDMYDESELSQAEMEQIVEESKAEIEQAILMQLADSTFFDDAGKYLAQIALETDEVIEIFGEGLTMDDVIITYADGTPVDGGMALMGNILESEGDGKRPNINVTITPRLSHFSSVGTGVRVEVEVGYEFTIQKSGNKNKLTIELTAFFEQEITVGFSVSGGAVWKKKWIFPYIADFRMSANLDLGTYTGLGITATAKLEQDKDKWGMPWPENATVAQKEKKLFALTESIKKKAEAWNKVMPEAESSASGSLAEKYADFMEDANESWVDIVSVKILDMSGNVDPLHLLAYGLKIDFVVSANLNVALGMTFYYENYKRHSFVLRVKAKTADSDTVELGANGYQFDFYVMGMLGIRAGVRIKATAGLFSTKLAGVGLQIEAGAYAQLWGYFYYHLENYKKAGVWQKDSGWSGALLIEIGMYLDINFVAEALNGKYAWKPSLYSNMWPFLQFGEQENVFDFAYADGQTFTIYSGRNSRAYALPTTLYDMKWMDLKSGDVGEEEDPNVKNFDGDVVKNGDDEERFAIELSNPKFAYNPNGNKITVSNTGDAMELDCVMTITWKGAPLAGSSEVLQRTVNLHWETTDLATVDFQSNGGTAIDSIVLLDGKKLNSALPTTQPTRTGYTFVGWYKDAEFTTAVTDSDIVTTGEAYTLYAKWNAAEVDYKVEHYQEQLDGSYVLAETENKTGYTAAQTVTEAKDYPGFTCNAKKTVNKEIAGDGSAVARVYYDRSSYTITFDLNYDGRTTELTRPYGSAVTAATPTRAGYTFLKWTIEGSEASIPETMPSENRTYTAVWGPRVDTRYFVKHYQEQLDGTYALYETEAKEGTTDTTTAASAKTYDGFTAPEPETITQQTISGDGTTVVEIKYVRNRCNITFHTNGGSAISDIVVKQGTVITAPTAPDKTGYTFGGWYSDSELTTAYDFTAQMTTNLTLYAKWSANDYAISYNLNGGSVTDANPGGYNVESEAITLNNPTKSGYTFAGWTGTGLDTATTSVTIAKGSTGNRSYTATWTANSYTVKFDANGGTGTMADQSFTYDVAQNLTTNTFTKKGYTFTGWADASNAAGAAHTDGASVQNLIADASGTVTLYAVWTKDSYAISYNLNGGSVTDANPGGYNVESEAITLNNPTKTGYTFAGWTGTGLDTATISVTIAKGSTGDRTYTATWTPISYHITFDLDGGSVEGGNPTTYDADSDAIALINPTKTGYTFAGWTGTGLSGASTAVAITKGSIGDRSYTATWTPNTNTAYTVEYYDMDTSGNYPTTASRSESKTGTTAETANADTTAPTGFTFASANTSNVTCGIIAADGSLVLKVYMKRNQYALTFNANGGTGGTESVMTYYGAAITVPTVTRDYYNFSAWDSTVADTMPAAATTYNAQWTPVAYNITYNLDDGSVNGTNPTTYTVESDDITLTAPTRTGYTFTGWTGTGLSAATETVTIAKGSAGDREYTANWEINTYTVEFNANNGTGTMANQTFTHGESKALSTNSFERSGYKFVGWSTYVNATEALYTNEQTISPTDDLYLFAVWQKEDATTYNLWVGSQQFTSDKLTITDGDGDKAVYDPESNILTLNNYTCSVGTSNSGMQVGNHWGVIAYSGTTPLNIVLVGENSITNDTYKETDSVWNCGLRSAANVTISGEGSLTITGGSGYTSHGISVSGDLTISGGTVNVLTQTAKGVSAIYATNVSITGGTVTATAVAVTDGSTANSYGIELGGGSLTISGGTVTAQGHTSALEVSPTLTGVTASASTTYDGSAGVEAYDSNSNDNYLWFNAGTGCTVQFVNYDGTVLQSSTVQAGETPSYTGTTPTKTADETNVYVFKGWDKTLVAVTEATTYTATYETIAKTTEYNLWIGGTQVTGANLSMADGVAEFNPVTNTLTLNGYQYTGEGTAVGNHNAVIGYTGSAALNIVLVNSSTIKNTTESAENTWSCGLYSDSADVVISNVGYGSLHITGGTGYTSHGISVKGNLTIDVSSSNLQAYTQQAKGTSAIYASGNVTITGGSVTARAVDVTSGSSAYSYGIECLGTLNITGGKLDAKGYTGALMNQPTIKEGLSAMGYKATDSSSKVDYVLSENSSFTRVLIGY